MINNVAIMYEQLEIWIVNKPSVSVYTRNHGNEELTFLLQLRQEEKPLFHLSQ